MSAIDSPGSIEYSWSEPGEPERPARSETVAEDGGTRLILSLRIPDTEDIARSCVRWKAHLLMLLAAIEGVPIKFPFERFKTMREVYTGRVPTA